VNEEGDGGQEAGALGSGAVWVVGWARLRWSAAGMRSISSDSQDLGVRVGVREVGRQSTASPIDARSSSPIPADWSLGGRKRPLPASDSFSKGGHQPVASSLHPRRSRPGKRGCLPRACRQWKCPQIVSVVENKLPCVFYYCRTYFS
jgi:hypothetical protein